MGLGSLEGLCEAEGLWAGRCLGLVGAEGLGSRGWELWGFCGR